MRISVSEWTALKLALKLPRELLSAERLAGTLRANVATRRGMAAIGVVLLALLVLLHVKAAAPELARLSQIAGELAQAQLIDARWETAAANARPGAGPAVHADDLARIERALDAAAAASKTQALRSELAALRKDYIEKADVLARYQRASADTRQALEAALRSDAAVSALVREAWSDFPQRERLVAAENLAVRVIVEAQKYHHAPSAAQRALLESHAADLPRARSVPRAIQAALSRLEADVHRILLLKPLEQMLGERLSALRTARRLSDTAAVFQRELTDALTVAARYRIALIVYAGALALLLLYLGIRAIARFRDLELLYAAQTREFARALRELKAVQPRVPDAARPRPAPGEEDARIVDEERI